MSCNGDYDTNTCTYLDNVSSRCTGNCFDKSSKNLQKQIWNQVRVPSSLYLMNKSSFIIGSNRLSLANNLNNILNGNQASDQNTFAIQNHPNPTRGNSLKSTLTSLKPGACAPGGRGVDIKHNSYARYLGRKKAGNLKTQATTATSTSTSPKYGNKTNMNGLVMGSDKCCNLEN